MQGIQYRREVAMSQRNFRWESLRTHFDCRFLRCGTFSRCICPSERALRGGPGSSERRLSDALSVAVCGSSVRSPHRDSPSGRGVEIRGSRRFVSEIDRRSRLIGVPSSSLSFARNQDHAKKHDEDMDTSLILQVSPACSRLQDCH
jgi:hypothetical protein